MADTHRSPCVEPTSSANQTYARETGDGKRPVWPMIVLRTPKGWTGPKVVDGKQIEGYLPRPPGAP